MPTTHFLLIEDNEGDILLTTEALAEGNMPVKLSVARNGEEAMDFLEKKGRFKNVRTPDLILLDINLPRMNGHEVLQRVKNTPKLKKIPVIMISTSASETDVLQSYENHVNCFITKPVELDGYTHMISSIESFWLTTVQLPTQYGW